MVPPPIRDHEEERGYTPVVEIVGRSRSPGVDMKSLRERAGLSIRSRTKVRSFKASQGQPHEAPWRVGSAAASMPSRHAHHQAFLRLLLGHQCCFARQGPPTGQQDPGSLRPQNGRQAAVSYSLTQKASY